jgi:UDP-glucose 4-epimerase
MQQKNPDKPHILVTGGTGYIGSHTIVELLNTNYRVTTIDNLSNSSKNILPYIEQITNKKVQFHELDLADREASLQWFSSLKEIPDAIIHFAAFKAVGESVENPLKYYRNNLFSLINLLESMQQTGCKNLVFSSSCTVYGQPEILPVNENAPEKKPESPYGQTKAMSEQILRDFAFQTENKIISLRYFNPIGAHESGLIGENPSGKPNNLVPMITQAAIGKRKELEIFGDDYDTPDGSCIRDYIHVTDIAKAHVTAISRLIEKQTKKSPEVFNLGTGKGYSVLETINTFEKINKVKVPHRISKRREGDVEKIYADTKLANQELGWHAEKTLEEMLSSAWKWEQTLKNRKP